MNTPIHKTKYATMTVEELIAFTEHIDSTNHLGPLTIELLERLKHYRDRELDAQSTQA